MEEIPTFVSCMDTAYVTGGAPSPKTALQYRYFPTSILDTWNVWWPNYKWGLADSCSLLS